MKTITTSKGEFVVVELPHGHIVYKFDGKYYDLESGKEICESKHFNLICKLSEATDDDASNIIETLWNGYKNYELDGNVGNYSRLVFKSAIDSLHSLLKSKGIDVNNGNWYLFEKLK